MGMISNIPPFSVHRAILRLGFTLEARAIDLDTHYGCGALLTEEGQREGAKGYHRAQRAVRRGKELAGYSKHC